MISKSFGSLAARAPRLAAAAGCVLFTAVMPPCSGALQNQTATPAQKLPGSTLIAARAGGGTAGAGAAAVAVTAGNAPSASAIAAARSAAPTWRLPETVARVNGIPISREVVDSQLELGPSAGDAIFASILDELVAERAAKLGITPTAAQIQSEYDTANAAVEGRLDILLAQKNMTRAQFEQERCRPRAAWKNLKRQGVTVSDSEVEQAFNQEYKSQMTRPEFIELYQIHVPTLGVAKTVRTELQAGTAWPAVFKKYSTDTAVYKQSNGFYGRIARPALPPAIAKAIAGLKPNQLSEPVRGEAGDTGYTIYKVVSITPEQPAALDKTTKELIRNNLYTRKERRDEDLVRDLVKSAKIADLPPSFANLLQPFLQEQAPPGHPEVPNPPGAPGLPPPPVPQGGPNGAARTGPGTNGAGGGVGPRVIPPPPPPPPPLH